MAGKNQQIILNAANPTARTQLGFYARSVIIDNYTTSFVRVRGAARDIPPGIFGAVVNLDSGSAVADCQLITAAPVPALPPTPSADATLTYVEDALSADAGHLIAQSNYQRQPIIGTITTAGGGVPVSLTFPVPDGAQGIQYFAYGGSFFEPQQVTIKGDVSQEFLINDIFPGRQTLADMARWFPTDSNAICTVTDQGGGQPCKVDFIALMFTPTLNVRIFDSAQGSAIGSTNGMLNVTEGLSAWGGFADSGGPALGALATCVLPAFAGFRYVCRAIHGELGVVAAPGAGNAGRLLLRDGITGVGTVLWSVILGQQNVAGAVDRYAQSGLAIQGSIGNAMTLEFNAGLPNIFESCGFGADIRNF